MSVKLPKSPTPQAFADAWTKEVLEPAVRTLAGKDGRVSVSESRKTASLEGPGRLAADDFADVFSSTGVKSSAGVKSLLDAGRRYALAAASAAAGPDGKLRDASRLPDGLRADCDYLRGLAEPRYSKSVARSVMEAYGLTDLAALLAAAADHDDGNGYFNRAELEAAAKRLAGAAPELGVVSDLDKTVIPAHSYGGSPPAPYPGVAALFQELELGRGGKPGDVTYVTARSPDRVAEMDEYLSEHGMPAGEIETGTSPVPWVAIDEKVRDISKVFDQNPGQKFVLFGDTSHKDPEVYRKILDRYPDRVTAVFIHKVNPSVEPARVDGMHLIENYAQAAALLKRQGVLDEPAARRIMKSAQAQGLAITDAEISALLRG